MTKIDIISGFLGAGKTTLIKKLIKEALYKEKVVLIENEFGEIGIDGGFLKEAGIEIREMNSGCICCSLVGDFGSSLKEVLKTYEPERILIEPSGVGKLSDVMKAVEDVTKDVDVQLNSAVAVVDAKKCKMYMKNFGEFFLNQVAHAGTVVLSRTDSISQEKLEACISMIREHNHKASIITTPWAELEGQTILETIENAKDIEAELMEEVKKLHVGEEGHAHHHGNCHGEEHAHHHGNCHGEEHAHHHGEEHENCCKEEHAHHHGEAHGNCHEEHSHHHEEAHEGCHGEGGDHHHEEAHEGCHGEGEDHHHHGEECSCGCHGHGHEGHHHADEVFTSWGKESPSAYSKDELTNILKGLENDKEYGMVLRAKGMVPAKEGGRWLHFDYVPGEIEVRTGQAETTGRICVIGANLQEDKLESLFV